MVKVFGHSTWLSGLRTPWLNSAVEVMVFMVDPGATAAVSAKSLKPALLAMARILPVDGWRTTMELLLWRSTADRASSSASGLIVVASPATFLGATMTFLVPAPGRPAWL